MSATREQLATTRIVGRVTRDPETAWTSAGVPVCRMLVAKEASGPASSPTTVSLYTKGDLARRCGTKLGKGDLVEGIGDLGPMRRRARVPEVIAESVKLFEAVSGRLGVAA